VRNEYAVFLSVNYEQVDGQPVGGHYPDGSRSIEDAIGLAEEGWDWGADAGGLFSLRPAVTVDSAPDVLRVLVAVPPIPVEDWTDQMTDDLVKNAADATRKAINDRSSSGE
jgi:hypothetical protein